jgi:hypothetical protein
MKGNRTRKEWLISHLKNFLFSLFLGLFGGSVCGAVILSLCGLAGRLQTTGAEYLGYWSPGVLLVGAMYGGPFGAIAGPVAYLLIVRTTGLKKTIVPAAIGTIACGFAGSLYTPMLGLPAGILGFFVAVLIVRFRQPHNHPIQGSRSFHSDRFTE